MNIVTLVKQVPDTETKIRVKSDTAEIDSQGVTFVVNPYDEYAVEEALKIKEERGEGEVTVVCMGEDQATTAIRTCLAMGADKSIHLTGAAFHRSDSYATALALSKAVAPLEPDIILCGKQAVDDDNSAVGIELAEMLDMPHVHGATKLEISEDGKKAVAHREIEGGHEVVEVELPAVITCEKGLNEPRYAALKGIMQAKRKPLEPKDEAALGLSAAQVGEAGSRVKVSAMTLPPPRAAGRKFEGELGDIVPQVVSLLHDEAKVI